MSNDRRNARVREYLSEPESRDRWLVSTWYSELITQAIGARSRAGLTQGDIAERMGTTQSAIARLENDLDAKVGAGRLVRYLTACGVVPMTDTIPFEAVMDGLMADPSLPLQASSFALSATVGDEDDLVVESGSNEGSLDVDAIRAQAPSARAEESALVASALQYQAGVLTASSLYTATDSLNRLFSDIEQRSNTYAAIVSRAVEGLADWNTRLIQQLTPVWSGIDAAALAVAASLVTRPGQGQSPSAPAKTANDHEEAPRVPRPDLQPRPLKTDVPYLKLMRFDPDDAYDPRGGRHQTLPPGLLLEPEAAIS